MKPKFLKLRLKPYSWQKYAHKYELEDVVSYKFENGLLYAEQSNREVVIPLENVEMISIFDQEEYDNRPRNEREDQD